MKTHTEFLYSITEKEIGVFVSLTGDNNPIHTDGKVAAANGFESPIAHGMLAASLFSTLIGTKLPGGPYLYLSQDIRFHKPIYVPSTITVRGIITGTTANGVSSLTMEILSTENIRLVSGTARVKKIQHHE